MGADCKSAGLRLRGFESLPHQFTNLGRAEVFCEAREVVREQSRTARAKPFLMWIVEEGGFVDGFSFCFACALRLRASQNARQLARNAS